MYVQSNNSFPRKQHTFADMIGTFLFQNTDDTFDAVVRRILKKNMYVVSVGLHCLNIPVMTFCTFVQQLFNSDTTISN